MTPGRQDPEAGREAGTLFDPAEAEQEPDRSRRSIMRELRRRKRRLERMSPLVDYDRFADAFGQIVQLESELREHPDDPRAPDAGTA